MSSKTANLIARVEPDTKEQAENILSQLGIPASVAINMLYKKIIQTRGIPFLVTLDKEPVARDEMTDGTFNEMMSVGLSQAKANESRLATDVIADIKKDIAEWVK